MKALQEQQAREQSQTGSGKPESTTPENAPPATDIPANVPLASQGYATHATSETTPEQAHQEIERVKQLRKQALEQRIAEHIRQKEEKR